MGEGPRVRVRAALPGGRGPAAEAPAEERQQRYQRAWDKGGFYIGLETYSDFLVNKDSNDTISDFIRTGSARRCTTRPTAELLAPSDHPFFTKRPPLETDYYVTYNRDNVTLVDINRTPIETITPRGVRTGEQEYEVDAIVFATGFDTMTGTLFKMGITGRDGVALQDKWADGPSTYLGLTTHGFPNLFMITGPQSPSVLSNMPVAIEQNAEWIAGLIGHMRGRATTTARRRPRPSAGGSSTTTRSPTRPSCWARTRGGSGPTSPASRGRCTRTSAGWARSATSARRSAARATRASP